MRPPFGDLTDYAGALVELVKDDRCSRTDADLVADALDRYSEIVPCVEQVDVGDGTLKEWQLGKAAEPFATWSPGFSERQVLQIERLYQGKSSEPPEVVTPDLYRIEERTATGSPVLWLVFLEAPAASPNQHRVRFKRLWAVDEVRLHDQMGVVEIAAATKCEVLQAVYTATRTEQSDLFQGGSKADDYRRLAGTYWARAKRRLGLGGGRGLRTGTIRTGKLDVFRGRL